ncbi:glycyl-radical enzyme activating protein [Candidatus Enterococcus ferrettii]|uniref:Pyruvate formate lyase activating enzyme n=1 Tax=Candidatus Enterococcus ferrettii TaxID=2815324 RepID=A0ABV0EWY2_9ENTE|nr:glycyl-radical enzyme activating protein [Enterococcus sp. 665A]MBO1338736.1 glycyl-radical enzyme activating protein [Enterococcus sp. 665A]
MSKGLVFNIQRYSVHDGGGIRTIIFLKGCPLKCPWCSNPESRKAVAPTTWTKNGKTETVGSWCTTDELVDEVMKDEIFYRTSGGGVTLSGGEVLMQADFAADLLSEFNYLGVHTAIETTGCFPLREIKKLTPYLQQVLFDLKIMDAKSSKRVIGSKIEMVKENFEFLLSQDHLEVIPRIPLIPGYTTEPENISALIKYLQNLEVKEVHLLPFHQYGSSKYDYLGWEYTMKDTNTLTQTEINEIKNEFEDAGIHTNVDGLE